MSCLPSQRIRGVFALAPRTPTGAPCVLCVFFLLLQCGQSQPLGVADAAVPANLGDTQSSLVDNASDATDNASDATNNPDESAENTETDASSDGAVSAESLTPDALSDVDGPSTDQNTSDVTGPCSAVIEQHPIEGATHVSVCSPVTYLTKPPSSGNHYPIWAAYKCYASAIPEGFWVHNLEHGAIVLSYHCPGGCTADVAAAQAWIDALPDDPLCAVDAGDARVRVVMTPDANLDVKFAASAWGWTLRANCFDPVAFTAFSQAHYGQGPEVLCAEGQDLSLGVPDGCGE